MRHAVVILGLVLFCQGCASIPKQSVELSAALTDQIVEMRTKHLEAINRYFSEVEGRIRRTMLTEYKDDYVAGMREKRRAKGKELTLEEYDRINSIVLEELDASMKDLERDRSRVLTDVMDRYSLMQAESQSLHGLLAAASKIQELRQTVTGKLEKQADEKFKMLESVDQKAQGYLQKAQKVKRSAENLKSEAEGIKKEIERELNNGN